MDIGNRVSIFSGKASYIYNKCLKEVLHGGSRRERANERKRKNKRVNLFDIAATCVFHSWYLIINPISQIW